MYAKAQSIYGGQFESCISGLERKAQRYRKHGEVREEQGGFGSACRPCESNRQIYLNFLFLSAQKKFCARYFLLKKAFLLILIVV